MLCEAVLRAALWGSGYDRFNAALLRYSTTCRMIQLGPFAIAMWSLLMAVILASTFDVPTLSETRACGVVSYLIPTRH